MFLVPAIGCATTGTVPYSLMQPVVVSMQPAPYTSYPTMRNCAYRQAVACTAKKAKSSEEVRPASDGGGGEHRRSASCRRLLKLIPVSRCHRTISLTRRTARRARAQAQASRLFARNEAPLTRSRFWLSRFKSLLRTHTQTVTIRILTLQQLGAPRIIFTWSVLEARRVLEVRQRVVVVCTCRVAQPA